MDHRILPLVRAIRLLARAWPAPRTYRCPTARALGVYAAQDLRAPRDVPARAASGCDGFLVRADAAAGTYRVAGAHSPSSPPLVTPGEGLAWRVEKGTPLPEGTGLVPIASATLVGTATVQLPAPAGEAIANPGSMLAAGTRIVAKGQRIGPRALALLAAGGVQEVEAIDPPVVHLVAIGSELLLPGAVDIDTRYIRDALGVLGISASIVDVVPDQDECIRERVANALAGGCVVACGGTGSGLADRTVASFRPGGIRFAAEGIALCPGETAAIALARHGACLFMPGDPQDVAALTHALLIPALARRTAMRIGSWEEAPPAPLVKPWSGPPDKHLLLPATYMHGNIEIVATRGVGGLFAGEGYALLAPGERERTRAVPTAVLTFGGPFV